MRPHGGQDDGAVSAAMLHEVTDHRRAGDADSGFPAHAAPGVALGLDHAIGDQALNAVAAQLEHVFHLSAGQVIMARDGAEAGEIGVHGSGVGAVEVGAVEAGAVDGGLLWVGCVGRGGRESGSR